MQASCWVVSLKWRNPWNDVWKIKPATSVLLQLWTTQCSWSDLFTIFIQMFIPSMAISQDSCEMWRNVEKIITISEYIIVVKITDSSIYLVLAVNECSYFCSCFTLICILSINSNFLTESDKTFGDTVHLYAEGQKQPFFQNNVAC